MERQLSTLLFGTYMFFFGASFYIGFVCISELLMCASVIVFYELLLLLMFDIAQKRHLQWHKS